MAVDCARISRLNCVATADQTIAVLIFFPELFYTCCKVYQNSIDKYILNHIVT